MFMQTTRWHDSVQLSIRETPQIVTQLCGVGSFASPPSLLRSLSEAHTLSHADTHSCPSACAAFLSPLAPPLTPLVPLVPLVAGLCAPPPSALHTATR